MCDDIGGDDYPDMDISSDDSSYDDIDTSDFDDSSDFDDFSDNDDIDSFDEIVDDNFEDYNESEDLEGIDDTEELDDFGNEEEFDEVEDIDNIEDLDESDGLEDIEDSEELDDLDNDEDLDDTEDVNDIENLDEAEDLENIDDTEELENLDNEEEFDETKDVDDIENLDVSDDLEDIEDSEKLENVNDVGNSNDTDISDNADNQENAFENLSDYMSSHNYGQEDFEKYSQDPEWRELQSKAFPEYELPPLTQENAFNQLSDYMNEYNFGADDFDTYSQDPKWQELHKAAFPDCYSKELADSTAFDNDIKTKEMYDISKLETCDFCDQEFSKGPIEGSNWWYAKGNNYDMFCDRELNYNDYSFEKIDNPEMEFIDPKNIEGVYLDVNDLDDGGNRFWSQHMSDGTRESFNEISSNLPDLMQQIDNGKTVEEIYEMDNLGDTARIFCTRPVEVYEINANGRKCYEFQTNGRHRILSARDVNSKMPVKVIGRYSKNNF